MINLRCKIYSYIFINYKINISNLNQNTNKSYIKCNFYLVMISINTGYLIVETLNIEIESKIGIIKMTKVMKNIDSFINVLNKFPSVVTINYLYCRR